MNTAKAYFEIYKALPISVKNQVYSMIIKEENTILHEIEQSLLEVGQIERGEKPKRNIKDLLNTLRNE